MHYIYPVVYYTILYDIILYYVILYYRAQDNQSVSFAAPELKSTRHLTVEGFSPPWHRNERKSRSRARRFIRWCRFTGKVLSVNQKDRLHRAIQRLEAHHTQPNYILPPHLRQSATGIACKIGKSCGLRMSTWKSWGGAWKTTSGGKGATKGKQKKKQQPKGEGESTPMFSAYDAMPVPDGGSSGSAASSSQTQDSKLKQLMKALVDSNVVKLPEEARHLLEDNPEEDIRSEMRHAQNSLNKRRKAHGRVHRLKAAIAQKHEQFDIFKRKLKDFLHEQQEKYDEDIRSLEQSLKEAEATLQTLLDTGEAAMEESMEPEQDLEQLLEAKPREQRIVSLEQQLLHSKSETQATKQGLILVCYWLRSLMFIFSPMSMIALFSPHVVSR